MIGKVGPMRKVKLERRRCKDWIGLRVRMLREITRSDGIVYPAGSEWAVDGTWRGMFHLTRMDGEKGYIRRVPRYWFEEVLS